MRADQKIFIIYLFSAFYEKVQKYEIFVIFLYKLSFLNNIWRGKFSDKNKVKLNLLTIYYLGKNLNFYGSDSKILFI